MNESRTSHQMTASSTDVPAKHGDGSEPQRNIQTRNSHWSDTLISGLTVIGVASAAAYASTHSDEKAIGITAWVAVAVVGASTMISTMKKVQR